MAQVEGGVVGTMPGQLYSDEALLRKFTTWLQLLDTSRPKASAVRAIPPRSHAPIGDPASLHAPPRDLTYGR